jgi:hypothetical protein
MSRGLLVGCAVLVAIALAVPTPAFAACCQYVGSCSLEDTQVQCELNGGGYVSGFNVCRINGFCGVDAQTAYGPPFPSSTPMSNILLVGIMSVMLIMWKASLKGSPKT